MINEAIVAFAILCSPTSDCATIFMTKDEAPLVFNSIEDCLSTVATVPMEAPKGLRVALMACGEADKLVSEEIGEGL